MREKWPPCVHGYASKARNPHSRGFLSGRYWLGGCETWLARADRGIGCERSLTQPMGLPLPRPLSTEAGQELARRQDRRPRIAELSEVQVA